MADLNREHGMTLYDVDFAEWAFQNADLLRSGKLSEADLPNIAEEIESLGRANVHELKSRLVQIMEHMLKLRFAPPALRDRNHRGWSASIQRQRGAIDILLKDSPSLDRHLTPETLADCYAAARRTFQAGFDIEPPQECPFSMTELLDR
jgi:hypothetical protein